MISILELDVRNVEVSEGATHGGQVVSVNTGFASKELPRHLANTDPRLFRGNIPPYISSSMNTFALEI